MGKIILDYKTVAVSKPRTVRKPVRLTRMKREICPICFLEKTCPCDDNQ